MPRQTSQDSIHALTEDNVQLRSTLRSLLAENRANATLLIQPYKKGQNIETWLRQFEVAASSVGLNGVSRGIQVLKYLPDEASAWLMRTVDLTHWPTIVEKLASVYGVDPHVQKTICRRKLESLKQGTRRVAEYRMLFETVVADFPQGHELPDSVLRHIFFSNLRDELKAALLGIVAPEDTWKTLAVAAATRESALFLGNDHLLFEAPQSVVEPPFPMTAPAPEPAGPTPMELDAFTQRRSNKGDRRQHRPVSQRPSSDPMRRWARPGVPICGHCGIEGHLTKRCFKKQNRQAVHALQEQPLQDTNSDYPSNEPSSDDVICSLTYMTKPSVAYRGPRLSCRLLNTTVQALVDTGASISAIDSRLVTKLGLEPNTKASVNFTTADNRNTSSLGTVNVNAVLGELPVYLRCHVVENLSYPIIIGYSDLAALKAIIDTANNTISFPDSNDRYSTKEIPCRAAENLRLPGHHHAYLQVCGTPQALAFVSTPGNLAAEKLLSVAAGVVRFDAAGTATIKTANLSTNINFINKGQQIAFLEYLPSSPAVFDISSIKHNQDHHETDTPSTSNPEPPMDFSSSISPSLPDLEKSQLTNLLSEFGDCFKSKPTTVTPRTQHHIDTGDHKPLSQPPHRASAAENDVISKLIDEMLQQGIVQPSNSPWSSPVVLVKKKDDTPRFCIDYRRLNNITTRDVYPLPRIDDTLHSLGNAKYFSTLDLTSSYWQIQLDQSSKPKSAFVCRRGLFEFVRMPFGLTNAPATMQRLMDSVLAGLKWQICLVYLDDIVVFSPSFDQHLKDVRSVLSRLRDAQLSANLKKCRFASQEISFLGYIISSAGLKTDPAKIRAVSDFPVPTNVEMLRSFLGLAGYYRSFISRFSAISAPLNSLLKRDTTWIWNDEHQSAYDTLKSALVSAPVLRFPDFERPFELHTDGACTAGIGVMLCQRDPDNNRVYAVAFASRSLAPNERNYGVSEVEALAIVWGIKKFAHFLTGTKFTVVTDHQTLQFFNSLSSDLRGRLARWSLYLQQHDYTIIYRPGKENSGPDALSRYPVSSPNLCSLTAPDLRSSQADDPFCQELRAAPLPTGYSDESGVLFFGSRPVLPAALRNDMFELLHANPTTGHLGIGRTLQRFNRLFYFPNLRKWVQEKISACETCQRVKTVHKTLGHTKLAPSDPPVAPFDTIAMDTFGPLPHSTLGNRYVIVTQCMFSRNNTPIPQYSFKVHHLPGKSNVTADVMSRYPPPEISPSDEEDVLVGLIPAWLSETLPNECQDYEEYLNEVVNYLRNPTYKRGIPEKVVKRSQRFRLNEQGELFRRVSDNRYLKVPPIKERIKVLREVHDGHGHFGKDATWARLYSSYWWPTAYHETKDYVSACDKCQLFSYMPSKMPLLGTVPINQLFERFAVDYVGPLPKSADGNQYIIVAVEYYTRWPIARAVAQANSETTIKFLYEEIFTCFGPPTHILSDNGTHFVSQDVEAFIKFVNTHHQYATPYHPQTNGRVEQFNGTLVRGIKKMTATHPKIWDTYLHSILYAYRTKCHQSIGISPYEHLYGIPPRSPNEDILQQIGRKMGFERSFFLQQRQLADEDNSKEPEKQSSQVNSKQLPVGSEVLRLNQLKKHKLDYNYRNQVYTVLASLKNNVYILANRHGKRLKRAINGAHLRRFVRPQPQQMLLENNGGWMKSSTQTFKTQNNSLNANGSNGSQI